jgi:hypothetical protein
LYSSYWRWFAHRLNPIYAAIRWYLDAPYCKPTSSWGRLKHERLPVSRAAVAGLEDLCSQSRRRHRVDRHVRGAHDLVWVLYGLLILRQSRRQLLWLGVTAHPNAEWLARQLTEACGWDEPPRYLIRDREGAYGAAFIRRIRAMGIRHRPVSARSPWQNGYAETLIGSIRRE